MRFEKIRIYCARLILSDLQISYLKENIQLFEGIEWERFPWEPASVLPLKTALSNEQRFGLLFLYFRIKIKLYKA